MKLTACPEGFKTWPPLGVAGTDHGGVIRECAQA
jgi:hypothetical protein